jgi:hypothetical protein
MNPDKARKTNLALDTLMGDKAYICGSTRANVCVISIAFSTNKPLGEVVWAAGHYSSHIPYEDYYDEMRGKGTAAAELHCFALCRSSQKTLDNYLGALEMSTKYRNFFQVRQHVLFPNFVLNETDDLMDPKTKELVAESPGIAAYISRKIVVDEVGPGEVYLLQFEAEATIDGAKQVKKIEIPLSSLPIQGVHAGLYEDELASLEHISGSNWSDGED